MQRWNLVGKKCIFTHATFQFISESKPQPPPKPQLPPSREAFVPVENQSSDLEAITTTNSNLAGNSNKPKMERAKSFVNVHKTSFQSNRIVPNDDLVLNQARRQKSFAGPSAKKIAQLKPNSAGPSNLQRAASLVNLEKNEEKIIRVRSLVEVEDYDGMQLSYYLFTIIATNYFDLNNYR